MKINPLDDKILVKPKEQEDKTASGIYLPESVKENPILGKVVATGPGRADENGKRTAVAVKKGDTVVYGKYGGMEVDLDGTKHVILREGELLGVVE